MVLKIRLARVPGPGGSRRHAPFYNIVLAQARSARDGKPMEVLGTYDPIPKQPVDAEPGARKQKDIKIDVSRAKYWLGVGAQPSDTAHRLLAMIGLLPPLYLPNGAKAENPLKAVRFQTQKPKQGKLRELLDDFNRRETESQDEPALSKQESSTSAKSVPRGIRKIPVGQTEGQTEGQTIRTTSPQNPNAA